MNTLVVERHAYSKEILLVLKAAAKFWPLGLTGEVQKDKDLVNEGKCSLIPGLLARHKAS